MHARGHALRLLAALSVVAAAAALTGCNVIRREMGQSSTEGVVEAINAAVPGADTGLIGSTSGFSSELSVAIRVDDASAVTAEDVHAAVVALCSANPVGYDHVSLQFASGEPGTADWQLADTDALFAQAFPDTPGIGAYAQLEDLCAAV